MSWTILGILFLILCECFTIAEYTLNGLFKGLHLIGIIENCFTYPVFEYWFLSFCYICAYIFASDLFSGCQPCSSYCML